MEEAMVKASIITPSDYVGAVMELCQNEEEHILKRLRRN